METQLVIRPDFGNIRTLHARTKDLLTRWNSRAMSIEYPLPQSFLDPAEVAAHYDDLDHFYRKIWGEHVHHGLFESSHTTPAEATRRLISVVAQEAKVGEGSRACDVGCGYGGTSRVLAREFEATVTSLTISKAQYAYANQVDPDSANPKYLLRDWLENELESESFDALIAVESSEHMPDLHRFFSESARVLRPGGRAVICAWLTRDPLRTWERNHLITPICREGRMRGMETAGEYQRLGREVGLIPVAYQDVSNQVERTWSICARRVVGALLRERETRQFLFRTGGPNRIFALTLLRIWFAYQIGVMRYGIITYEKA